MKFSSTLLVGASIASVEAGALIKVTVGKDGNLNYSPQNFEAEVGDEIQFSYFPKNHTVVQSSFADPCHPLEGGFFSGFVPTPEGESNTTFTITVKDSKPIWFYCAQGPHCQKGMVGAINAPETGNTFTKFRDLAAKASNSTVPPTGPAGGVLSNGGDGGDGSNPPPPPSNSTTTASSSDCSRINTKTYDNPPATTITSAWTTQEYTSTWTSAGQVYTTTAASTLVTEVPVSSQPTQPPQAAAAPTLGNFRVLGVTMLVVAGYAMLL